ncbi:MAG: glycosyltransferase family 2 protein [Schwartzia sp.]|nr:glycosyltransferase family 2 protein [Schwartzia sp. (in: firmicutes)]
MKTLAVIILARNEAENIADCLATAAFADEVLVVDSGSEDGTPDIAREKGARVVDHPMTEGFAAQRNYALTQTTTDWVLYLDADERLSPEIGPEIRAVMAAGPVACYEIERQNVVFGQRMRYGPHRPDWSLRLFPRTAVRWEGIVHEVARVELPVRRLRAGMLHYTYTRWSDYFAKFNRYTTLAADEMRARGRTVGGGAILSHSFFAFFRSYVLRQGFREGFLGLVMSLLAGGYTMVKYLKLKYGA